MYRDNASLSMSDKVNFVLNHGALGDVICSLPALVYARQTHHESLEMLVWTPPWLMDLVSALLAPYGKFTIKDFSEFPMTALERQTWGGGPVALNSPPYNTHTRNRVHMVDFAFNFLLDAQPENQLQRSYPTLAPLGEWPYIGDGDYVVFPVGSTSENKLFRAKVMAPIIEWVASRGYTPVLVGTKTSHTHAEANGEFTPIVLRDEVDKLPEGTLARCMDLREKTTLLKLRDICGYAAAVVSVDGGTTHLAGTTNTNIIYAMTTTIPEHRYIPRGGDPHYNIRYVGPRDLECTGCQSKMTLLFGHDFRLCPYGDNVCVDRLHSDDFIEGLKQLGL